MNKALSQNQLSVKEKQIRQLLTAHLQKIQKYIGTGKIEAFRLYNNEEAFLPLLLDIYQDNAVLQVLSPIPAELLKQIEIVLGQLLKIKNFFYKNRTKDPDYVLPGSLKKNITINEYGHRFLINLSDYLDTGLFLDHRDTRRWIEAQAKGKIVLNTFAYTGSFTVYAAAGGARKTYSVDLSRVYCEWMKQNLALNDLNPKQNWVYKMDTLEFLRYAKNKKLIFDIIIIDPPTFSKNKGRNFSVQKDHPALINSALELLSPDGFILFSNNFVDFRLNRAAIKTSSIKEKMDAIPPDFANRCPHRCFIIKTKKI